MKNVVLLMVAIAISAVSQAQEISENAIGLRLGGGDGYSTEVNYQRALGAGNRLEFGLGFLDNDNVDGFQLSGIYQWVWNIDGGFNWYAGPGAGLATVQFDNGFVESDTETSIFLAGQVGIEYNFDIPLLLSLDTRPVIDFGDVRDDLEFDIALGIRYQF
jgi:hypothetical protein